jgi:hypothetical protein
LSSDRLSRENPAIYRIQVQGSLDQQWADYLDGLKISVNWEIDPPVTTLFGQVIDQAPLIGIINGLYDLGYPLLSVEYNSTF